MAAAILLSVSAASGALAPAWYSVNGLVPDAGAQGWMQANRLPPGACWLDEAASPGMIGHAQPILNIHGGPPVAGGGDYALPGVTGGSGSIAPNGDWSHDTPGTGGAGGTALGRL
jgi:hypothetical protein